MQEKITLYFSLSVVLKYKVPVYCYCKKFGEIKKMLDEDQVTALNLAKNGQNLLITGQAGCGKTFLVKEIAKQLKN
jgi:DNA replication protein DnaC